MVKSALYVIMFLSTVIYLAFIIIDMRKNKNFSIFTWYIFGALISYYLPFLIIELADTKFNYEPKDEYTIVLSYILILLTIVETNIIYKFFIDFRNQILLKPNTLKRNNNNHKKVNLLKKFLIFFLKLYSICLSLYSAYLLLSYRNLIIYNDHLRKFLMPMISKYTGKGILLLAPLGVSIFYLNLYNKIKSKKVLFLFFTFHFLSLFPVIITGQRTALILSIILPLLELYREKKSNKILMFTAIGSLIILIVYSFTFKRTLIAQQNILMKIITGDIDMNWNLWFALEQASIFSSKILPYPGSGFFYTLLAFIPRELARFKGYNSNAEFTVFFRNYQNLPLGARNIQELSWGYKFGQITETILNFGYLGIIILPILYGFLLAMLEVVAKKYKVTYGMASMIGFFINFLTLFTNITLFAPILIIQILLAMDRNIITIQIK